MGNYGGFEVFQPIINGIGGNLVSVQSSRIATMLHTTSLKGIIPQHTKQWVAPWTALFRGSIGIVISEELRCIDFAFQLFMSKIIRW